jgi:signal transduction histidine kinase
MISPNIPSNESVRLHDLYRSNLLDTPEEQEFNEIVSLASDLCDMPISLITLVDADRQWFKARIGLEVTETTRDVSFCGHAILQDELFEVPDALLDLRFNDNPLVLSDPSIRFYAGVPLVTDSGSRLGTLCVIDRTPRTLTEQQRFALKVLAGNVIKIAELRIKNKQLHNISETQKRIISIVAHDVRNPLAAIKSVIELKKSDYIDEETSAEMLDMVKVQLNNTLEMVDNVVNWGQLQLNSTDFVFEELNLHNVVDEVFAAEALSAKNKANNLLNQVEAMMPVFVDKQVIKFILRNLVSNANKFTENGSISIAAKKLENHFKIIVEDTGVGMTADKAQNLFAEGEHTSSLGTNNEKGSGLGLMLLKEFVDQIKGTIAVESTVGEGTRFMITI